MLGSLERLPGAFYPMSIGLTMRAAWRKTWLTPILVAALGGALAYGLGSGNMSDETSRKFEGSNEMVVPIYTSQDGVVLCDLPIQSAECPEDTKGWEGSSEDDRVKR